MSNNYIDKLQLLQKLHKIDKIPVTNLQDYLLECQKEEHSVTVRIPKESTLPKRASSFATALEGTNNPNYARIS